MVGGRRFDKSEWTIETSKRQKIHFAEILIADRSPLLSFALHNTDDCNESRPLIQKMPSKIPWPFYGRALAAVLLPILRTLLAGPEDPDFPSRPPLTIP